MDETLSKQSHPESSRDQAIDDVFGNEKGHQIHYKTMSWPIVSLLMIVETVGTGILPLPNTIATVGLFPAVFLMIFFGVLAIFTGRLLVNFKLNHPEVHSMGDAGMIMFGPIGREVLTFGTLAFAIIGSGSGVFSGQQALLVLSNNALCGTSFSVICAVAMFLFSLPRTLSKFTWLALASWGCIVISGLVAMIGSGLNPVPGRVLHAFKTPNFYQAFLAITNPVFAYSGHFMFFVIISEMKRPQDAMKAIWVLQIFAITFYTVFAIVCYAYVGDSVQSISFFSLPPVWSKVAFGFAFPNILMITGLYIHVPAKLIFMRIFRHSKHVYSHTWLGWLSWIALCFGGVLIAFLFAVAVPTFTFLIGLIAAMFASWYTYGIAGFFWIHDARHLGKGLKAQPVMTVVSVLVILAGAFICIAGTYVFIKLIVDAYAAGIIPKPFTCNN